jgi:hypothetical protein
MQAKKQPVAPVRMSIPVRPMVDDPLLRIQPCIGQGDMVAGEVVRMVCSNEACTNNQYVPLQTFEQFEDYVLMQLRKSPRARGWTPEQCRAHVWTKKGYELVYRACGCNCGQGFVRRDMQYMDPMILYGDGTPPQPKPKPAALVDSGGSGVALPIPTSKPGLTSAQIVSSNAGGSAGAYPALAVVAVQGYDTDDEEGICPLCMEEMDSTDQTFLPCPCGYQVMKSLSLSHLATQNPLTCCHYQLSLVVFEY